MKTINWAQLKIRLLGSGTGLTASAFLGLDGLRQELLMVPLVLGISLLLIAGVIGLINRLQSNSL